ncbi:MAG: M20 family metallo-hydrolase [Prevotella sp.]|nr:M20 family metallo-hydrolase [Prevotella sp.]
MDIKKYTDEAVELLECLIAKPSISRDEALAADVMEQQMKAWGLNPQRFGNNIAAWEDLDNSKPTLLLNAHIDTVKPVKTWTRDPFKPTLEGDRLYGLGANDCGGGLVSLLTVYRIVKNEAPLSSPEGDTNVLQQVMCPPRGTKGGLPFNLVFLASCEEEVSGQNGIALALPQLPPIDVAIVGEPTGMQPAIAEKGLMVIDATAHGKSGHAARNEGINAINEALDDLVWLRDYQFKRVSPLLGPVKMSVTVINSGTQHNVVPDRCDFIIDVRTNELYTNEEAFRIIDEHTRSTLKARSFRLSSSSIPADHPLVQRCVALGMTPFGSPTLSDQALMPFPSLKLGPGESARSHSADEYICISEIKQAIETYLKLVISN